MKVQPHTQAYTFVTLILSVTAAGAFAFSIFSLFHHWLISSVVGLCLSAPLVWLLARGSRERKADWATAVIAIFVCLIAMDFGLGTLLPLDGSRAALKQQALGPARKAATDRHVPFDGRTPLEVLRDLRNQGANAGVSIGFKDRMKWDAAGNLRSKFQIDGHEILPLGNESNKTIVYCNESGVYSIYQSDRFGFRNPDAVWDQPVDVVLIGDSFVQGACVGVGEDIASYLRRYNLSVLSIGMGGSGPLRQLAAMVEYLPRIKARFVVWLFYAGNDFRDLAEESRSPLLMTYLEKPAGLGLTRLQGFVDTSLEGIIRQKSAEVNGAGPGQRLLDALFLRNIRHRLGLSFINLQQTNFVEAYEAGRSRAGVSSGVQPDPDFSLWAQIVGQAKALAAAGGSRLVIGLLPDCLPDGCSDMSKSNETRIRVIAKEEGIEWIDLGNALSAIPENQLVWYPGSHLAPRGYEAVATTLKKTLVMDK